jgi:hypothetical protein
MGPASPVTAGCLLVDDADDVRDVTGMILGALIVPPDAPVRFEPFTVDELRAALDRVLPTA